MNKILPGSKTKILFLIFFGSVILSSTARAQSSAAEVEAVRNAVLSYFKTSQDNLRNETSIESPAVDRKSLVFSVLNNELSVKNIDGKPPKRKGKPVRIESVDNILLIDVANSAAVVKVEKVYPFGSLTREEFDSLPAGDSLKTSAGTPIRIVSYLCLLKIAGNWKIVSFLIPPDAKSEQSP